MFYRTDYGGILSKLLDSPHLLKWRWKQFFCNEFDAEPQKLTGLEQ